jgi:hypothetical protein
LEIAARSLPEVVDNSFLTKANIKRDTVQQVEETVSYPSSSDDVMPPLLELENVCNSDVELRAVQYTTT